MAKKRKTYVGRWMRLSRLGYFYQSREKENLACKEGVRAWFESMDIPFPVKRFRVHATPHKKGEWCIGHMGSVIGWRHVFSLRRTGLVGSDIPPGQYHVTIEYEEL